MHVLVRDDGFHPDDLGSVAFITLDRLARGVESPVPLMLESDDDPAELPVYFPWISAIRIRFPSFDDGRGFSLAVRLRQLGYQGRLGATGHLISDQYPQARRSGFDEVVIDELMAARQPEPHWLAKSAWKSGDYQQHLLQGGQR